MEQKEKWLPLRGAITLCQKYGRDITKNGLIYIGKELNFIRKSLNKHHWEYEKTALLNYLKSDSIPQGWVSIGTFAFKMGISVNKATYILLIKYKLEQKKYGKLRGIIHVREKDAITAFKKHKGINNVGKEEAQTLL